MDRLKCNRRQIDAKLDMLLAAVLCDKKDDDVAKLIRTSLLSTLGENRRASSGKGKYLGKRYIAYVFSEKVCRDAFPLKRML